MVDHALLLFAANAGKYFTGMMVTAFSLAAREDRGTCVLVLTSFCEIDTQWMHLFFLLW